MKNDIAIAIVGAGSSYTPELIDGLLALDETEVPVREIRLHDRDAWRLEVMAGLSRRMVGRVGRNVKVLAGTDLEPLVRGADFVICQIRVGGMDARHLDESIPLKYGIIGQETTGPGGMFKALRTIPPMLEVARTVERVAPEAFILNYTNPSGIVAEALLNHTKARFIGLCSGIPGIQAQVAAMFVERWPGLRSYCIGLNHLGFIHRFECGGQDVTRDVLAAFCVAAKGRGGMARPEYAEKLGAIPIGYLDYYLRRNHKLGALKAKKTTRAEDIRATEAAIFAEAGDPACDTKPEALARRGGGGYASITFRFLRSILHDRGEELVCTVLNRGAVEGLPDNAGVEVVCRVGRHGAAPLPVGPIPLAFRGLVQAVKAYETLTVEAAVTGRRSLLVQALINHPLVGDLDVIEPMVDEMLAANRHYLGNWRPLDLFGSMRRAGRCLE